MFLIKLKGQRELLPKIKPVQYHKNTATPILHQNSGDATALVA